MKNFKIIMTFLILTLVFFSTNSIVDAKSKSKSQDKSKVIVTSVGNKLTKDEFDNLLRMGFTELAIDQMPSDIIKDNKDIITDNIGESTVYQEVIEQDSSDKLSRSSLSEDNESDYHVVDLTKEEYFNKVNSSTQPELSRASNTTKTSYRRLTTTVSSLGKKYRVNSKFIWDKLPKTRSYDVLTTSIDSTFTPVPGSNYGTQLWTLGHKSSNPTPVTHGSAKYKSSSKTWTKSGAGYGVRMNLKDSTKTSQVLALQGYSYFDIERSNSVVPKYVNAYGNYSHAQKNISSNISYGLSFGGPSISWGNISSKSFSAITTHARTKY